MNRWRKFVTCQIMGFELPVALATGRHAQIERALAQFTKLEFGEAQQKENGR